MSSSIRSILGHILCSRLEFYELCQKSFRTGFAQRSQIVPSCRLILLISGSIAYTAEEETTQCHAGTALFVPPWIWRGWEVVGPEPATVMWTTFMTNERILHNFGRAIVYQSDEFELLQSRMAHMLAHWSGRASHNLLLEGEFKSLLSHFFLSAPEASVEELTSGRHPEVDYALSWLQANYAAPSALSDLQQLLTLNQDYFRDMFRQQMHQSPGQYLTMLRMRAARYFLDDPALSIKEIAQRTGYRDQLYFSRAYRKFWGHAPSEERR